MPRTQSVTSLASDPWFRRSACAGAAVVLGVLAGSVAPARASDASPAPEIYVAPSGSDTASGDQAHPLATLTRALSRAAGGEQVTLAPGRYPAASDRRIRSTWVTVVGPADGSAVVDGLAISGGSWLDVGNVTFTAGVSARSLWTPAAGTQAPAHIHLHDGDFSFPGGTCVTARDGATDIVIEDNEIHDCLNGFGAGAGGTIVESRGLAIVGNRIEHMTGDAIQFGQWNDVVIAHNVIDGSYDPANRYHNDGVQLTGNSSNVRIEYNTISNSRHQLIFIQDAVGAVDHVLVQNNLVFGAGAVAIQSLGAERVRLRNNTVWANSAGGLRVGGSTPSGHPAAGVEVTNNILSSLTFFDGATARLAGNVVPCATSPASHPEGVSCVDSVGFEDAALGDYHLTVDAPARGLGFVPTYRPTRDLDGMVRDDPAVPGAYR
jgi:hypothetical protein